MCVVQATLPRGLAFFPPPLPVTPTTSKYPPWPPVSRPLNVRPIPRPITIWPDRTRSTRRLRSGISPSCTRNRKTGARIRVSWSWGVIPCSKEMTGSRLTSQVIHVLDDSLKLDLYYRHIYLFMHMNQRPITLQTLIPNLKSIESTKNTIIKKSQIKKKNIDHVEKAVCYLSQKFNWSF